MSIATREYAHRRIDTVAQLISANAEGKRWAANLIDAEAQPGTRTLKDWMHDHDGQQVETLQAVLWLDGAVINTIRNLWTPGARTIEAHPSYVILDNARRDYAGMTVTAAGERSWIGFGKFGDGGDAVQLICYVVVPPKAPAEPETPAEATGVDWVDNLGTPQPAAPVARDGELNYLGRIYRQLDGHPDLYATAVYPDVYVVTNAANGTTAARFVHDILGRRVVATHGGFATGTYQVVCVPILSDGTERDAKLVDYSDVRAGDLIGLNRSGTPARSLANVSKWAPVSRAVSLSPQRFRVTLASNRTMTALPNLDACIIRFSTSERIADAVLAQRSIAPDDELSGGQIRVLLIDAIERAIAEHD